MIRLSCCLWSSFWIHQPTSEFQILCFWTRKSLKRHIKKKSVCALKTPLGKQHSHWTEIHEVLLKSGIDSTSTSVLLLSSRFRYILNYLYQLQDILFSLQWWWNVVEFPEELSDEYEDGHGWTAPVRKRKWICLLVASDCSWVSDKSKVFIPMKHSMNFCMLITGLYSLSPISIGWYISPNEHIK